jgi:hypothetical protein
MSSSSFSPTKLCGPQKPYILSTLISSPSVISKTVKNLVPTQVKWTEVKDLLNSLMMELIRRKNLTQNL